MYLLNPPNSRTDFEVNLLYLHANTVYYMNKVLYYVVTRLKFLFCNLVSWRCLFSRLDFLIRKVGAGCRSEPYSGYRRSSIETSLATRPSCDERNGDETTSKCESEIDKTTAVYTKFCAKFGRSVSSLNF